MPYLLDSNVFIQAKNRHYGFDFCPAFWDWLIASNNADELFSVEKVGDEIRAGKDELSTWASERGSQFFLKPDETVVSALKTTSEWATRGYDEPALGTFFKGADHYLVAHALAHRHTLVTHEIPSPSSKKRIKLPDACSGLDVEWMTPYKMLRREKARFVLGSAA